METSKVSVVAPVYNEVDNLRPLMTALREALDDQPFTYEVILVDDGSTDGSRELLRELTEEHPMLRVLFFRRNFGQTAAMGAGFDAARGEVIVPVDADLQNDPLDIPMLVEKLDEGWDIVSGWRKDRQDASARVLPSRIANHMISRFGKVPLHDTGCTLKAYRREIVRDMDLYGEMHRFLPIYGSLVGARVTELPVRHHARHAGVSKYGFNRIIKIIPDLMWVMFLRGFSKKPIQLFGGFGLGAFALAGLTTAGAIASAILRRDGVASFLLASLILAVGGMISILLGFQAEVLARTYHESQGKKPYIIGEEFGSSPLTEPENPE